MFKYVLLSLAAVALAADEEAPLDAPRLLASKFPQSMYAVEKMDLVIEYSIYNTGDKTAYKVQLNDQHSFPTQSFEIIKGQLVTRFDRIAPGANVTHSVIVRPNAAGVFNYTAAQVTYTPSENSNDYRIGYTNAPGEGYIYRLREYERKFAPKWTYWILFFIIIAVPTVPAFLKFYSSAKKYEITPVEKKEKKTA